MPDGERGATGRHLEGVIPVPMAPGARCLPRGHGVAPDEENAVAVPLSDVGQLVGQLALVERPPTPDVTTDRDRQPVAEQDASADPAEPGQDMEPVAWSHVRMMSA